ncbi:MAG: 2-oxoacid:acceptor oxidoreductase family protein [bacterium JZ-2024 1]
MSLEVRISGFGGQGIVLAGYVLGKAASLYDGRNAVLTQSYGPEARGGASAADVVIATSPDETIDYPKVQAPHILVTMSQDAYNTYRKTLRSEGLLIYDSDLVIPRSENGSAIPGVGFPATRLAEERLGKRIAANIVMLGALAAVSGVVSYEAMKKSVETSVKKQFVDLNLKALELGYEEAQRMGRKYAAGTAAQA